MEYEGLHQICFHCGKYGHKVDNYPDVMKFQASTRDTHDCAPNVEEEPKLADKPNLTAKYGPGMIAQSRQRRRNSNRSKGSKVLEKTT